MEFILLFQESLKRGVLARNKHILREVLTGDIDSADVGMHDGLCGKGCKVTRCEVARLAGNAVRGGRQRSVNASGCRNDFDFELSLEKFGTANRHQHLSEMITSKRSYVGVEDILRFLGGGRID